MRIRSDLHRVEELQPKNLAGNNLFTACNNKNITTITSNENTILLHKKRNKLTLNTALKSKYKINQNNSKENIEKIVNRYNLKNCVNKLSLIGSRKDRFGLGAVGGDGVGVGDSIVSNKFNFDKSLTNQSTIVGNIISSDQKELSGALSIKKRKSSCCDTVENEDIEKENINCKRIKINNNNNNNNNNKRMYDYVHQTTDASLRSGALGGYILSKSDLNNLDDNIQLDKHHHNPHHHHHHHHHSHHLHHYSNQSQQQQQQQQKQFHHQQTQQQYLYGISNSMATLSNIGNTCYLNSVIYTLRFAPNFLHNLHHLVDDLSQINKKLIQRKAKISSLGRNITGLHAQNARSWSSKDLVSLGNTTYSSSLSASSTTLPSGGGTVPIISSIATTTATTTTTTSSSTTTVDGTGMTSVLPAVGGGTSIIDIDKNNRQMATEKLHELYRNLHLSEQTANVEPFHADTFLSAIQAVSSIFEGNQQQDAHEFLMCLLDSIRETCQSVIKVIGDCPDIIMNGYVNLPEQIEMKPPQFMPAPKKTSFFSRKSKRKEFNDNNNNIKSTTTETVLNMNSSSKNSIDNNNTNINSDSDCKINNNNNKNVFNVHENLDRRIDQRCDNNNYIDKEKLNEKIRKLGYDFFTEDFEGITVSTTKCLSCETITEQKETMIDLSIPITGFENAESNDKPHLFIQNLCITREQFRGDNKYRCEQCLDYTEAIRTISYPILPRLLIIQLKRFSGGMEKINSYIPTPFLLQCFCSKCYSLPENKKLHVYKLYSVITHVGATLSVGHYIAYTCSLDLNNNNNNNNNSDNSNIDNHNDNNNSSNKNITQCNEYMNCAKEKQQQLQTKIHNLSLASGISNSSSSSGFGSASSNMFNGSDKSINNNNNNIHYNGGGSASSSKYSGFVKKIIFGKHKASSSGDITKNIKKSVNGTTGGISSGNSINSNSNNSINGSDNQLNVPCKGLQCCGINMKVYQQQLNGNNQRHTVDLTTSANNHNNNNGNNNNNNNNNNSNSSNSYDHHSSTSSSSTASSTTSAINSSAINIINNFQKSMDNTIWYMCDDDKIKAMSQCEFEELLQPNKKNTITPYLLFYARMDLSGGTDLDVGLAVTNR